MRLATFLVDAGGDPHVGAQIPAGFVDFRHVAPTLPQTLLGLLAAGAPALETARAAVARAVDDGLGGLPAGRVRLLAPLPRPGKIFGIGFNYREHAAETGTPIPSVPFVFLKAATAVIGPGAAIELPPVSNMVDYEGELAVVIGRRAKRVRRADALAHVAGYTIMNDVSARDYQKNSGHSLAKSFDTFAPMGPVLVTTDEVPDPHALALCTRVSGETMQHSTTAGMIFDIPALIEYISAAATLEPGDMITTGTPAGVGARRTPPRFLRPGDTVSVEIAGIGTLTNPVVSAVGD
jgi:2-keto-4-pentenoate hydratase/2-oxohepta-3-ene-1,7-dioic acid hydratase in catechol pathway